ncbi:hypothetical protein [Hyalangium sp.]|uniref:hypothetical protein n=1 Tax=Hyalangium sp. TaxID=2028555 RepID=UPI002D671DB9|nr:hypothetical protein [Hyalangium sp.]HYH98937.1 hypothetical protein [Hyalangium sp.]
MERSRSPRPSEDSAPEAIGHVPEPSPLAPLLEAVRSPHVITMDVDALMRGLARPLANGESPRARADLLLSLIESPLLGSMQDRKGASLRTGAVKALLDLGYPYALELPPEALAEALHWRKGSQVREIPTVGIAITLVGLAFQAYHFLPASWRLLHEDLSPTLSFGAILIGAALGPSCAALLGGAFRLFALQQVGVTLMTLLGSLWLIAFAYGQLILGLPMDSFGLLALVSGLSMVVGSRLLKRPEWLAEATLPPGKDAP